MTNSSSAVLRRRGYLLLDRRKGRLTKRQSLTTCTSLHSLSGCVAGSDQGHRSLLSTSTSVIHGYSILHSRSRRTRRPTYTTHTYHTCIHVEQTRLSRVRLFKRLVAANVGIPYVGFSMPRIKPCRHPALLPLVACLRLN